MDSTAEKEDSEIDHERIERIVERKVEERLEKENKNEENAQSEENISRRDFLKQLGAGAAGLGLISMLPSASALNFRTNDLSFYGADSTREFQVNDGGPVEVQNADFLVRGSNLQRSFAATLSSHKLNAGEFTALDRFTVPSGSDLRIYVVGITNDSFNTPSGLNIIVRNQSTGTNELTYNTNHQEGEPIAELTGVGSDNIVLAADNGNFGGGTGSTQVVTARIKYEIL